MPGSVSYPVLLCLLLLFLCDRDASSGLANLEILGVELGGGWILAGCDAMQEQPFFLREAMLGHPEVN